MPDKDKRGGRRDYQPGRPLKYGEPTKSVKVPHSMTLRDLERLIEIWQKERSQK